MKKITVMLICLFAVFAAASCYDRDLAVQKTASYGEHETSAAGVFLDRGITLAGQGEHESAIADFTEAIRLDPI
jgi:tetratricopeptide (TPR) repeat protein